jgi:hypothetical protein
MTNTLGTHLKAFSHRPQRQLLVALSHANPQGDTPPDSDDPETDDEALEILLDFQEYHLPELESKGFIDYDRESHSITKGDNFDEVIPLLELIDRHRDELPDNWL